MRYLFLAVFTMAWMCGPSTAYIEAPHTLGLVVRDSTHIVLVQVTRVNK